MKIPTPSSHDGTSDSITLQRVSLPVYLPRLFDAASPATPELYLTPLGVNYGTENGPLGYEPVAPRCSRYTEEKGDLETSYKTPTSLASLLMAARMDTAAPAIPDLTNLQSSQFFNRPLILAPHLSETSPCRPSLRPRWEARGKKAKRAISNDSGMLLARDNTEDDPPPEAASVSKSRLPTMPDSSALDNEKRPALKPRMSRANPFVHC
jgi:hypothetical protein